MSKIAKVFRRVVFWALCSTDWYKAVGERAMWTEVGMSGHVSVVDEGIAKKLGLKPLNRFERWLLQDEITATKRAHLDAFQAAFKEVTGEDLYGDGSYV